MKPDSDTVATARERLSKARAAAKDAMRRLDEILDNRPAGLDDHEYQGIITSRAHEVTHSTRELVNALNGTNPVYRRG